MNGRIPSWMRFFASEAFSWAVAKFVQAAAPVVFTAVTAWSAFVAALPLWLAVPMALTALCCSACFVNAFNQWADRQRVRGKLYFTSHQIILSHLGYQHRFHITNKAEFDIAYEVIEIRSQIGDRAPAVRNFRNNGEVIPPGMTYFFDDAAISPNLESGNTVDTSASMRIRYGRPGRLIYEMSNEYRFPVSIPRSSSLV